MAWNLNNKYISALGAAVLFFQVYLLLPSCKVHPSISFNDHIRPILNKNCTNCHGGVKREAGLSLLFREDALAELESGNRAIVPGSAQRSELYARLLSNDPDIRMPMDHPALDKKEIELLRRWIEQGAEWEKHWAYASPVLVQAPKINSDWARNDIDLFILDRLNKVNLTPNEEADRTTLIRRFSLDLTGLPPELGDVDAFVNETKSDAYEKVIDRLLDSPHYGEKWASMWLDLARYADSKGYEKDRNREIWQYRDWVIDAFNDDKPFDDFTIEQLAGDLLPNPKPEDYVATGFHRNTMTNSEGGTQNEEFRMAAVIDRVNTTWEVWNSTSYGCAQCQGHPYDPFTQKEYYEYMDFFNDSRDQDIDDDSPNYKFYPQRDTEDIEAIGKWVSSLPDENSRWSDDIEKLIHITEPKIWSYTAKVIRKTAHLGDDYLLEARHGGVAYFEKFPLMGVTKYLLQGSSSSEDSKVTIRLDNIDGRVIGVWDLGAPGHLLDIFELDPVEGFHDIYLNFESPSALHRSNDRVGFLFWIIPHKAFDIFDQIDGQFYKEKFLKILRSESKKTPILVENLHEFARNTFVLDRGSWMSPKDRVEANVPKSLTDGLGNYPKNRLGLAQWLVDGNHPLTSRVIVNRIWEQLFSTGIVETLEDFGTQGFLPSHPKLLDYLAERFENECDWSLKSFLKEVMLSATYRQSSDASEEKLEKDPFNRLLSRGPRFRLSAEQLRDQALAVSGLMSRKIKGPSVMPYLPKSAWNPVYPQYNRVNWKLSEGEDRHRRGIYTYWKRSSPYPANMTFDVQNRTVCASRRIRTNTPLQALVMLNDPVYIEAANALGKLMERAEEAEDQNGIAYGYKRALAKMPNDGTLELLTDLYADALDHFEGKDIAYMQTESEEAYEELNLESPMAVVANAIMNLDEFMVKD